MDNLMCRSEFLQLAIERGKQYAADVLLMIGPDGYLQSYDNYQDLMYHLTDGRCGAPMEVRYV